MPFMLLVLFVITIGLTLAIIAGIGIAFLVALGIVVLIGAAIGGRSGNEGAGGILAGVLFVVACGIALMVYVGDLQRATQTKPDENYEMNLAIEQSKMPPPPQWQYIVEYNGTSRVRIKLHGTPSYEGSSVSCSLWARNLSPYTNKWAEMYNRYEDTTYDGGWLTLPIADFRTFLGKRGMEPGSYPASCTIGIAPRLARAHGHQTLARFGVGTITYSLQEPQTTK